MCGEKKKRSITHTYTVCAPTAFWVSRRSITNYILAYELRNDVLCGARKKKEDVSLLLFRRNRDFLISVMALFLRGWRHKSQIMRIRVPQKEWA